MLLVIFFSIPAVQTYIAQKITDSLNETYGTSIHVEKVRIKYNGKVALKKVLIRDHHQDTLIATNVLETSILSIRQIIKGTLDFGSVDLEGAHFYITKYKDEPNDNLYVFTHSFSSGEEAGKPVYVAATHVEVSDGHFRFLNKDLDNPSVVDFKNLNLDADNFVLDDETVNAQLNTLAFDAKRGYKITALRGAFHYDPNRISLQELVLESESSQIAGTVNLDITGDAFGDFVNRVVFDFDFTEASLNTTDLQPFYNGFGRDRKIDFKGLMRGTLNDFTLSEVDMRGLGNSKIRGDLRFEGLFRESGNFRIDGDLQQLQSNYFDLAGLLPESLGKTLPKELIRLGLIDLRGKVTVTENSIYAKTDVRTGLGGVVTDLKLNDTRTIESAKYEGNLKALDFNLGKLLNVKKLGKISFNLNVDGSGFNQEKLDTRVSGFISKVAYNGYTYKNMSVSGNLQNPVFDGQLQIDDPNARFYFNGLVDVTKELNTYDFIAEIDYLDLAKLNFLKDSIAVLKGKIAIDMEGTNIDDVAGTIKFGKASFQNANDLYSFDDFKISSTFQDNIRTIDINSPDIISGEIEGNFKIDDVVPLFRNAVGSLYANYVPSKITTDQFMDFNLQINSKIVEVFVPDIQLEPGTFIRGSVVSNNSDFKLTFRSPQIKAFGFLAQKVNVQVDNKNELFNTFVEADSIGSGVYGVSHFSLINVTLKDTLFMRSEFTGGPGNKDIYDLNFYHTINQKNKSVVGFRKSGITFKGNNWFINEANDTKNKIVFDNSFRSVEIEELVMSHNKERISLAGQIKDSTYKDIKSQFSNVRLSHIAPYIDSLDLRGLVNGNLNLLQQNGAYYPDSGVTIDSLVVNDTHLGNLDLSVKGNESLTSYSINSRLLNGDLETMVAKGEVNVSEENPSIDLDLRLSQLDLSAFGPLGGAVLSNIRGLASGKAKVVGDYKNPDINGELLLRNAGLGVPYLNVDYDFEGTARVNLSGQQFRFLNVALKDTKYKTDGRLKGTISHKAFKAWELDLDITTDRLAVLDTKGDDFSLYYGTAFISGNANIKGPTGELVIGVTAKTEKGTTFKIPLSDTESFGDNRVIYFLSPEEKAARLKGEEVVIEEIKGLELNFDLEVTRDAEVEIVVDQVNGSTLRGRGAGYLLIQINTNGKFNMFGDFTPYEGVYNFRYSGVVQKQFDILPEGKISWDGSPARALLDISAVYKTQANPSVLLENPSINRKIPVNVIINLDGELEHPDFTFDFKFPTTTSIVTSELEYRLEDRATRELQAFSLVTQGSFYSQNALDTQSVVAGNLIETASGIFNDILSDDDGKFTVGLDYVQGDRSPDLESSGRFGFTVSTQISKSILINGKVGVPVGGVSESVVVGDVEVNFLLNEDGSLRATVFNRQDDIQFFGQREGYTQGVGLTYSVDFNTVRELFRKILEGKGTPVEEDEEAPYIPADSEIPYEGLNNED